VVNAFRHRVGVKLLETKSAARNMKLKISEAELDALFEHQGQRKQPSSAITIRNRLSHDFGPTQGEPHPSARAAIGSDHGQVHR
jgi:hypothetical protein